MELMLIDRNSTRMFSIVEGRHEIELKGSVSSEHDKTKKPTPKTIKGFPSSSDGKESACNAEDPGLISGSGRSPGEGMAIHSSILAWRIPWTEEPGGYSPWDRKVLDTTELLTLSLSRH